MLRNVTQCFEFSTELKRSELQCTKKLTCILESD